MPSAEKRVLILKFKLTAVAIVTAAWARKRKTFGKSAKTAAVIVDAAT